MAKTRGSPRRKRHLPHQLTTAPRQTARRRHLAARRAVRERLEHFLARHPTALRPTALGGLTFKEIAARLDASPRDIGQLWRELKLPDRHLPKLPEREERHRTYLRGKERHRALAEAWRARNIEKTRVIRRAACKRWLPKVLRDEVCVVCGRTFGWTNGHEQRRRYRGARVVCSRSCSMRAALAARDAATRRPPPRT